MYTRFLNLRLAVLAALVCAGGLVAYGISQEEPLGSLKGTVIAQELGAPLKADIYLSSTTKTDGTQLTYHTRSADDGTFDLRRVVAGRYKLEIRSEAHSMRPAYVTIAEGATQTVEADLKPDAPSLDLYVHQHVYLPDESAEVTCHGFLDSDQMHVSLYRIDPAAFLLQAHGNLPQLLTTTGGWMGTEEQSKIDLAKNPSLKLASSVVQQITKRDVEGVFTQRIKLPALPPGLYVTAVRSGSLQRLSWLMVTSIGLITKSAGNETLVYAVDLKSGDPVPSATVSAFAGKRQAAAGRTGSDGITRLTLSGDLRGESDLAVLARSGGSYAFVTSWFNSNPSSNKTLYVYTDRPVYRPAQRVFYRGILRDGNARGYRTPKPESVVVEVRDPSDTLIQRVTRLTDKFGCYSGSVYLNDEAPTGHYSITTIVGGEQIGQYENGFSVAAYRKPEFSVKAQFDHRRYTRGDVAKVRISATYYFGAPVANATLHYNIQRSPYYLFAGDDSFEDGEGYSDYGGYGETVTEGDVRTDENGEALVEVPAEWPQPSQEDGFDQDQQFTVSLTVTDKAGAEATGEASMVATRGLFAIEVSPESFMVKPGSKAVVSLIARDYDRRPVKRQPVTVTLSRQTWSDEGEVNVEEISERDVVTDSAGRASVSLPINRKGSLRITARSVDQRGNDIVGAEYLYSCSQDMQGCDFGPVGDVQIVLDKKNYNPGDTAQALIMTKRPGGTALVTVEGDRVYDVRTVKLNGSSASVSIPVKPGYQPNFYVAVSYVRNKTVAYNQDAASISVRSQSLHVRIAPDKRRYKPREKATYHLKVTDEQGKPVSASLSMGVVDEAIYAIEPDSTEPILDFFYSRRENRVTTGDSMPQIYLSDPDKAGAPLRDRPSKIRVRKRFLDTAYWSPSIVTDASGEASVSFEFPDNLTTWRTTVRAVSADTRCGQALNSVIEQQDMLVRLEMPRFLVQHDQTTLSAIVHNYTGRDQQVKVRLKSRGLRIRQSSVRTVFVRDKGSERLDWDVTAPRVGTFAVSARAEGERAGDEVQLDLPVKPKGERIATASNAVIGDGGGMQTAVYVRKDAIADATRLKIRLAPSLASSLLGSLDYLAEYPYGCTEQTTSTFLPDVVLYRSLKSLGGGSADLQRRLPDMVRVGLARLYSMQQEDGGWSWCSYGESDPWMTAYVMYALIQTQQAGFPVRQTVMDSGRSWLESHASSHKIRIYPRAFCAYVLALYGSDSSAIMEEIAHRRNVNNEALAVLALGFQKSGKPKRAKAMLDRLYTQAISDAGSTHWPATACCDGGSVETTALALQATLKLNPHDRRAYGIVRWLMHEQRDNYWFSTRGTAMVIYAMSQFVSNSSEMTPDYTAGVQINGRTVRSVRFNKSSILKPEVVITVPGADLRPGRNEISITKAGKGNLYYSTDLVQYVARRNMAPIISDGLSIKREYFRPSPDYFQTGRDIGPIVDGARTGEFVIVRLTIHATRSVNHALLEDNIPAGCEIIDRGDVFPDEWGNWWVGQDIRDDRIAFYLDYVHPGKQVIEYQMRAGFGGSYCALPAQVFAMYDPSVRATTGETEFTVR